MFLRGSVISNRAGSTPLEIRNCSFRNTIWTMSSLNSPQKHCISNSKGNLHVFQHQSLIWPYHLGTVMLSKCPHISSTITLCGSQLPQKRHIFWINLGSDLYKLSLITSAQDSPLKMSRDPARAPSLLRRERTKSQTKPLPSPWKSHARIRDAHPKKRWKKMCWAAKVEQWRCQVASRERAAVSCHAWTWTGKKMSLLPARQPRSAPPAWSYNFPIRRGRPQS